MPTTYRTKQIVKMSKNIKRVWIFDHKTVYNQMKYVQKYALYFF